MQISAIFCLLLDMTQDLVDSKEIDFTKEFIHMIVSLGLVLALVVVTVFFIKRFLASRSKHLNRNTNIKIIEQRALQQKSTLYLIEVDGKKILIADSACGVTHLADCSEIKELGL